MLSGKHKHHGLRIQAYQGVDLVIMGKECPLFEIKDVYCVYIEGIDIIKLRT